MATETKAKKAAPATKKAAAPQAAPAVASKEASPADARNALQKRRTIVGTVASDKMQKTIVVKIDRQVRHAKYSKYITKSRRFKAHDEKNDAKIGDRVLLVETRPLSRDKRWVLQKIVRRAGQAPEANV